MLGTGSQCQQLPAVTSGEFLHLCKLVLLLLCLTGSFWKASGLIFVQCLGLLGMSNCFAKKRETSELTFLSSHER